MEAGRPVFCEKPLGPDLATATRVAAAPRARAAPGRFGAALVAGVRTRRRRSSRASEYGRPLATAFRDDQYFPIQGMYGSTWRKDVEHAGGGTLIEHSIHDIDVLHWLLGEPVVGERTYRLAVRASGHRGHRGGDVRLRRRFGRAAHERVAPGADPRVGPVPGGVLRARRALDGDDYLGPLHVQTSDGTREITGAAARMGRAAHRAARSTPSPIAHYGSAAKAFLDRLSGLDRLAGAGRRSRGWSGRSVGSRGARRAPPRRPGISLGRLGGRAGPGRRGAPTHMVTDAVPSGSTPRPIGARVVGLSRVRENVVVAPSTAVR